MEQVSPRSDKEPLLRLPQYVRRLLISARLNTAMYSYRTNVDGELLQKCRLCHNFIDTEDRWDHVFIHCEVVKPKLDEILGPHEVVTYNRVFSDVFECDSSSIKILRVCSKLLQERPECAPQPVSRSSNSEAVQVQNPN